MRLLLIPVLALLLFPSVAQTADVNYEGQPVGAVEVVTNPSIDVQSLNHLLQQKAGQPYSNQRVRATIDALRRTGTFKDVDVQVKPEAAGLRVQFVLEPAYYYGVAQFPGALKVFPYTRLLQVVNLPDQDPYEPRDVEKAESALLEFLHTNGFFQAQLETSTVLDHQAGLANLFFQVKLGKRARIGQVKIEGPPPQEAARLLSAARSLRATASNASLKTGKPYSPERVKAGAALIKRYLSSHDFLESRVDVGPPQYRPEKNRADLTIRVTEGPKVSVKVTGAKLALVPFLAGRRKKKLIPVYQEGTVDPDLVSEGQRNLINFYQSKGYFDVRVTTDFQQQGERVSLDYNVVTGKKHKVTQIAFRGNQHIDEDDLLPRVAVKKKSLLSRGSFSDKLLRQSVNAIKAYYVDHGFEEVSVTPEVVDKEPAIAITFQVAEGPQTQVEAVSFMGNSKFSQAMLTPRAGFQLKPGTPFSAGRMSRDRGEILAVYLNLGYLSADVQPKVERLPEDKHRVKVTYQIKEGQQVRIGQVAMVGEKVTRPRLIARSATLKPESPLSQGKLLESESQLYNLGIFDWASVGPRRPITDQTDETAVVKVHEAKRNSVAFGFGLEVTRRGGSVPTGTVAVPGLPTVGLGNSRIQPSEQTFFSPRGTLEFTRRNIRGLGETGSIAVALARLDQRFVLTFSDPNFRWTRWNSLFSLSAERTTQNPLFAARLENASFQLERGLNADRTRLLQVRYRFEKTDLNQLLVPELVLPEDRNVRLSTFSGTLLRDTRDKPLDAHRGIYESFDFGITGSAIGASASFTRFLGQTAYYHDVGHGIVWANNIRLGLEKAYGGSRIPTSERFFSGGGTTLRGFPINGAGPQRIVPFCSDPKDTATCSNVTVPVGGRMLFVFNSEGRFPLPVFHNLGAVLFYDGGNVYNAINASDFFNNYTNTVGVGLRYSTPVGPVRIDVGRNLNPVPGFSATQFFITLGQAF